MEDRTSVHTSSFHLKVINYLTVLLSVVGPTTAQTEPREDDQTWLFRGSKSINKVSEGEPARDHIWLGAWLGPSTRWVCALLFSVTRCCGFLSRVVFSVRGELLRSGLQSLSPPGLSPPVSPDPLSSFEGGSQLVGSCPRAPTGSGPPFSSALALAALHPDTQLFTLHLL